VIFHSYGTVYQRVTVANHLGSGDVSVLQPRARRRPRRLRGRRAAAASAARGQRGAQGARERRHAAPAGGPGAGPRWKALKKWLENWQKIVETWKINPKKAWM